MKLKGTRQFISDADAVMYSGVNTARSAAATMRESIRFATTASFASTFLRWRPPLLQLACRAYTFENTAEFATSVLRSVWTHADGCVDLHSAVSRDTAAPRMEPRVNVTRSVGSRAAEERHVHFSQRGETARHRNRVRREHVAAHRSDDPGRGFRQRLRAPVRGARRRLLLDLCAAAVPDRGRRVHAVPR